MALTDSIVAYWKLDESSGNATDATGNGYTMTNGGSSGVTFVAGKIGNSAHFENTYPNNQDSFSRSGLGSDLAEYTISFWVKSSSTTANNDSGVISAGSWAGAGQWTVILRTNGAGSAFLYWDVYGNSTGNGISSTTGGLFDGTWRHCAVTYSDTTDTLKFYIDGSLDKTSTSVGAGTIDNTGITNFIGQYLVGSNYRGFNNGELDEIGLWGRVLSDAEIASLYNSGSGLQYPFATNVTVSQGTPPSVVASIPAYTVTATQNVTVSQGTPPSIVASIPAYTVKIDVTPTPAVQSATFSIPAYTAYANDVVVAPAVQGATFSIPAYVADAVRNIDVAGTVQSAEFSIPPYTVVISATVSADVQSATFSIPAYATEGTESVSISASVQDLTFSIPAYQVDGVRNITVASGVQVLTFSLPSYTISTVANISLSMEVQVLTFSIPSYRVLGDYWQNKFSQPANSWSDKHAQPVNSWNDKY